MSTGGLIQPEWSPCTHSFHQQPHQVQGKRDKAVQTDVTTQRFGAEPVRQVRRSMDQWFKGSISDNSTQNPKNHESCLRAINLIDLVTKTRGADHLKMGSRHLNLLQGGPSVWMLSFDKKSKSSVKVQEPNSKG